MKIKYKPLGQYFSENHDKDDISAVDKFLGKTAPFIGYIVHDFNTLEEELNLKICEEIQGDFHTKGAIVIYKMPFSAKIDLFSRLIKTKENLTEKKYPSTNEIILKLRECNNLRNAVVHAEWESMTSDGYTYVNLKFTKKGWEQEYRQFDIKSLNAICVLIHQTYIMLENFEYEMYGIDFDDFEQ